MGVSLASLGVSLTLYPGAASRVLDQRNSQGRGRITKPWAVGRASSPGFPIYGNNSKPPSPLLSQAPATSSQLLFIYGLGMRGGHSDLSRPLEGTRTPFGDGGLTAAHLEAYFKASIGSPRKKHL